MTHSYTLNKPQSRFTVLVKNARPTDEVFSNANYGAFNVTKYLELFFQKPMRFSRRTFDITPELIGYVSGFIHLDQATLDNMTPERLNEPVCFAELSDGTLLLIDGHHRLMKRHQLKLTTVRGYVMPRRMLSKIQVEHVKVPRE